MIILSKHLKELLRRSSCFSLMDESSHLCIVSSILSCSYDDRNSPNKTEPESGYTLEKISSSPSQEVDAINNEFDLAEIQQVLPNVIKEIPPECDSSSPLAHENDAHNLSIIGGEKALISAMKGSREERGMSVRNMSVTWAPDVYDPLPMIEYPRRRGKKPYKPKKNTKNKQKGKKGKTVPRKASLTTDYYDEEEYEEVHPGPHCGGGPFCKRYPGLHIGTT